MYCLCLVCCIFCAQIVFCHHQLCENRSLVLVYCRTAHLTMLYKIRHELVCMNNMTEKLQPAVARQRRGHTYQYVHQDAVHNNNNCHFYLKQSKIGITYPRALWRPQPSTLLCQGPPNRLHSCLFWVFFHNADLPFKSDRIINLLIAVALMEEEELFCK